MGTLGIRLCVFRNRLHTSIGKPFVMTFVLVRSIVDYFGKVAKTGEKLILLIMLIIFKKGLKKEIVDHVNHVDILHKTRPPSPKSPQEEKILT